MSMELFKTKCLKLAIKCGLSFNIGINIPEFGVGNLLDSGVLGLLKTCSRFTSFPIYIDVISESCKVLRVGIKPSDPNERSNGQGKQGVK